jgi:hypothetical protein
MKHTDMPVELHPLGPKYKKLFPQFAPPETWRTWDFHIVFEGKSSPRIVQYKEDPRAWERTKIRIRTRDNHTCRYCGFRALKWQVVHHIDGNHKNNVQKNLQTICPMCNAVLHVGRGCTILEIVDLFGKSRYVQSDVIRRTRILRASGYSDEEIVETLRLKEQVPFKQDRKYLRRLTAFVSCRPPTHRDFMTKALEYGYEEVRRQVGIQP